MPRGPPIWGRTLKSKIAVAAESAATATQARIRPRTKAFIGFITLTGEEPSLARDDSPALEGCASRERQHCQAKKGGEHCGKLRHSGSHAAHPSRLPAFGDRSSHQKVPSSAAKYTTTDYPCRMVGCTTCSPTAQVPTFSRRIDAPYGFPSD